MNLSLERLKIAIRIQKDDPSIWTTADTVKERELQDALKTLHDLVDIEVRIVDELGSSEKIPPMPSAQEVIEEATRDKTKPPGWAEGFMEFMPWWYSWRKKK